MLLNLFLRRNFSQIFVLFILLISLCEPVLAQTVQITQLIDSNPDWGCVLGDGENRISFKGNLGKSQEASITEVAKKLSRDRRRFKKVVKRLKDRKNLPSKLKKKLREAKANLRDKTLLLNGVKKCQGESKSVNVSSIETQSFAFICQHAFNLRSAADGEDSCGIDLRSLQELRDQVNGGTRAFTLRGAVRIISDSLGDACRQKGGLFMTPEMPELFYPLYHGFCATDGQAPATFSVGKLPTVLGMETVNEDCLLSRSPAGGGAKDPCDCYDPDDRGGGSGGSDGGSGGGEKAPPSDEDCLVMRMETVNEDC
ncbi:MAG: hypothetical protein KDD62_05545 [Bdellovibrionales bacterium]|nr:hypothetical protein [Bdellovibrionales bacterium]